MERDTKLSMSDKDLSKNDMIVSKSNSEFTRDIGITAVCPEPCLIYMSRMPGVRAKDQAKIDEFNQVLADEVAQMSKAGIKGVVCLLSKDCLKKEGVSMDQYKKECFKQGIQFFNYHIKSMKAPSDTPADLNIKLIDPLVDFVKATGPMLVHCKNGIGRAGTVVACLMARLAVFDDVKSMIEHLRLARHKNCVQSGEQEAYVHAYTKCLNE